MVFCQQMSELNSASFCALCKILCLKTMVWIHTLSNEMPSWTLLTWFCSSFLPCLNCQRVCKPLSYNSEAQNVSVCLPHFQLCQCQYRVWANVDKIHCCTTSILRICQCYCLKGELSKVLANTCSSQNRLHLPALKANQTSPGACFCDKHSTEKQRLKTVSNITIYE